eukprot:SAG31_NODE_815_length_11876_cov_2.189182_2_plen_67_part_00
MEPMGSTAPTTLVLRCSGVASRSHVLAVWCSERRLRRASLASAPEQLQLAINYLDAILKCTKFSTA